MIVITWVFQAQLNEPKPIFGRDLPRDHAWEFTKDESNYNYIKYSISDIVPVTVSSKQWCSCKF